MKADGFKVPMDATVKKHGGHVRVAKQDRSRASFERVLDAAEALLCERGYGEVTLHEVSRKAKVSIGSIYGRVNSKDDLLRALQVRVLDRIESEHHAMVNRIRRRGLGLHELVPTIIKELANFLHRHAAILSVFMQRATADPVLSAYGKQHYVSSAKDIQLLMLDRRNEIGHRNPEHAVATCFSVVYASLARYLGLGTSRDVAGEGDWNQLVDDLGLMCLSFLVSDTHHSVDASPVRTRGQARR
jgi:AcrR family transcriptional regulator